MRQILIKPIEAKPIDPKEPHAVMCYEKESCGAKKQTSIITLAAPTIEELASIICYRYPISLANGKVKVLRRRPSSYAPTYSKEGLTIKLGFPHLS